MADSGLVRRILASEPEEVGLVAEACVALVSIALASRVLSLATLTRFPIGVAALADRDREEAGRGTSHRLADRLAWAVDAASGRLGGRCLLRSVALQWLLARHGIAGTVCVGVPGKGRPFPGHAWVEVDEVPLGADGAPFRKGSAPPFDVLCRLPARLRA